MQYQTQIQAPIYNISQYEIKHRVQNLAKKASCDIKY